MAVCAIVYLPSLFWALGLDQNIFAEIGSLLLKGKKLYVDAWDVKPPNVFYVYAFFEWIFGSHDIAVRISDYVFTLFACAAIFFAADRHSSPIAGQGKEWVAPLASILLVLTLLSLGLADTAQTESYSLVFLIAASILVQPHDERPNTYLLKLFVSGICIAIAVFFKTSHLVFLLAIGLEIWTCNVHPRLKAIGILLAGCIAWSLVQFGVLAFEGSLTEYLRISWSVFFHHTTEVSNLHWTDFPRALWTYLDVWNILAATAFGVAIAKKDSHFLRSALSPLLLLGAGIAAVLIQNKGWGYQFVVVLPGLVGLCAISAAYLYKIVHSIRPRLTAGSAVVLAIATLVITPSARRRVRYTRDAVESITNHSAYLASLGSSRSLYYPPATDSLAQYLEQNTLPQERVFIFGDEPGAYWRANRLPVSRYVYALLFPSGVITKKELLAMEDTLVTLKPSIIAIERFDTTAFRGRSETSESILMMDSLFHSMRDLLFTHYRVRDTLSEKFLIYRLVN